NQITWAYTNGMEPANAVILSAIRFSTLFLRCSAWLSSTGLRGWGSVRIDTMLSSQYRPAEAGGGFRGTAGSVGGPVWRAGESLRSARSSSPPIKDVIGGGVLGGVCGRGPTRYTGRLSAPVCLGGQGQGSGRDQAEVDVFAAGVAWYQAA